MNDFDYFNACAIAAMSALIAKVPLADKDAGQDADGIGYEICKSADRYAADMVRIRRERLGSMIPEAKESNAKVDLAPASGAQVQRLVGCEPSTGEKP